MSLRSDILAGLEKFAGTVTALPGTTQPGMPSVMAAAPSPLSAPKSPLPSQAPVTMPAALPPATSAQTIQAANPANAPQSPVKPGIPLPATGVATPQSLAALDAPSVAKEAIAGAVSGSVTPEAAAMSETLRGVQPGRVSGSINQTGWQSRAGDTFAFTTEGGGRVRLPTNPNANTNMDPVARAELTQATGLDARADSAMASRLVAGGKTPSAAEVQLGQQQTAVANILRNQAAATNRTAAPVGSQMSPEQYLAWKNSTPVKGGPTVGANLAAARAYAQAAHDKRTAEIGMRVNRPWSTPSPFDSSFAGRTASSDAQASRNFEAARQQSADAAAKLQAWNAWAARQRQGGDHTTSPIA